MTVAIVGAGATGGFLGATLARAGIDVVLIARGAHLAAMREKGVTVLGSGGERFTAHPRATDEIAAVGEAEHVFLTLKAHSIPALAPALGKALPVGATVIAAQNGIPWWYFPDRHLESVDPGGMVARSLPISQVVGCVVYPATRLAEPGVVEHLEGNRFSLGEPDDSRSERLQALSRLLGSAGLKAPVTTRIRSEIWLKLLGNATLNPVSALTRASLAEMTASPDTRRLLTALMEEVGAVAAALGVEVPLSIEQRLDGAAASGEHKTSMLQDLEAGRPLELGALVGAVVELAGELEVPVPRLQTVYDLARQLEAANRKQ